MEIIEIFDKNIDFLKDEVIVKVIYMNSHFLYLRDIESNLKDITTNADVSFFSNCYLEFNRKGVNKGQGLLLLAELLGIKQAETIAIGVHNVVAGMKDDCDFITKADHNHEAIEEVIEKFILNK